MGDFLPKSLLSLPIMLEPARRWPWTAAASRFQSSVVIVAPDSSCWKLSGVYGCSSWGTSHFLNITGTIFFVLRLLNKSSVACCISQRAHFFSRKSGVSKKTMALLQRMKSHMLSDIAFPGTKSNSSMQTRRWNSSNITFLNSNATSRSFRLQQTKMSYSRSSDSWLRGVVGGSECSVPWSGVGDNSEQSVSWLGEVGNSEQSVSWLGVAGSFKFRGGGLGDASVGVVTATFGDSRK